MSCQSGDGQDSGAHISHLEQLSGGARNAAQRGGSSE